MLTAILILLTAIAVYSLGMWLYLAATSRRELMKLSTRTEALLFAERRERVTYHLGLCAVLSLGFIGLLLVFGGP